MEKKKEKKERQLTKQELERKVITKIFISCEI